MKKFLCILSVLFFSFSLFAERPVVKNIQAIGASENSIIISWTNPKKTDSKITKLFLYRTYFQITSYNQLADEKPAAELDGNITIYKDTVSDDADYFYTVLAYTDKLNKQVLVSINSTTKGVHVISKKEISESETTKIEDNEVAIEKTNGTRNTPLPFLDLVDGLEVESQISNESIEKAKAFASTPVTGVIEIKYPHFFEEDLISNQNKDDYSLFEILKNTFNEKKYKESIPKLQKLSKKRISQSVLDRTLFYLGEAYYFTGDYSNAVMCFIQVEKKYPLLSRKWISASLDKIEF